MFKSYQDLKSRAWRVLASPLRIYRDNGKDNGNYRDYRGYIGLYRGHIGIMEKKMGTTGMIGAILG